MRSTARNDSERPVDSFCAAGNGRLERFGLAGGHAKPNGELEHSTNSSPELGSAAASR
jgi:hypothetical protein